MMISFLLSILLLPCVLCFSVTTSKQTLLNMESRRESFSRITSGLLVGTGLLSGSPSASWAVESSTTLNGATFTDPINHPGGTRTIQFLPGMKTGDYQLAQIQGGGGRGEPKSYILPAVIIGDATILIDFSSKGGPKDFVGTFVNGDIVFKLDGNKWPRVK